MKNQSLPEIVAVVLVVLAVVGAILAPFMVEPEAADAEEPPGIRSITLTGMVNAGYWTEEDVDGATYWTREFSPARPVLRLGEPVLFRFKSADVVHTFYDPGLGIGPVEVYPGHVAEVVLTPEREGVFGYFCTTVCGGPHFAMRGVIIVRGRGEREESESVRADLERIDKYWLSPSPPPGATLVERGKWLFHQKGCGTCHGESGEGGIRNFNYVSGTVPELRNLASKMFLYFPEDVQEIVDQLESGRPLEELQETTSLPRFNVVLAQYNSIRDLIRGGNPAGKLDPEGPPPPLEMPAWRFILSERDIDAVIAYLLTLQYSDEGAAEAP